MSEFGRSELEKIFRVLIRQTKKTKQYWKLLDFQPLHLEIPKQGKNNAISQKIEAEALLSGQTIFLTMEEKIYLADGKGDVTGTLSYHHSQYGIQCFNYGLSYNWEKYNTCTKENVSKIFQNSLVLQLNSVLMCNVFKENTIPSSSFISIDTCKSIPLVLLCEKLAMQGRSEDFHNIIFDINYREKLLYTESVIFL